MPLATVVATLIDTKAPKKLKTAAPSTARPGEIARVETIVAMALAVSWNPLVKSKNKATATTVIRVKSI
jgi:hypothetical protein